ncbi:hypothetical protein ACHAWX_000812 [Stephanocyclus meneghinianus]
MRTHQVQLRSVGSTSREIMAQGVRRVGISEQRLSSRERHGQGNFGIRPGTVSASFVPHFFEVATGEQCRFSVVSTTHGGSAGMEFS